MLNAVALGEPLAARGEADAEADAELLSDELTLGKRPPRTGITRRGVLIWGSLAALVGAAAFSFLLAPAPKRSPGSAAAAPQVLAAPPARPSARDDASLAYDPGERRVILFGGLVIGQAGLTTLSDTWSWDGTGWTELHPASAPPGLSGALVGYDPASRRLVLTGGATADAAGQLVAASGTWSWDGSTWSARGAAGLPSSDLPRDLATDQATGQLILLTTRSGCTSADTWEWAGGTWVPLHPLASPSSAVGDALAFDPGSAVLDLFPSTDGCASLDQSGSVTPAVWAWDGSAWRSTVSPAKSAMTGSWELTSSASGALLVTANGTYIWSGGSGGRWSRVSSSSVAGDSSIAYDAADDEVVLFSGICSTCEGTAIPDTWTWRGSWTLQDGPQPPAA